MFLVRMENLTDVVTVTKSSGTSQTVNWKFSLVYLAQFKP